jgi:hypothetical protein
MGALKKHIVLPHKILIRVVFYHKKVVLKVLDESIKKWLKKKYLKSPKKPKF